MCLCFAFTNMNTVTIGLAKIRYRTTSTMAIAAILQLVCLCLCSCVTLSSSIDRQSMITSEKIAHEYEKLISNCIAKVAPQMELCVQKFNRSFQLQPQLLLPQNADSEKSRRYCCEQSELKDCWTAKIVAGCSDAETRLAKWLPLQVLTDLRTDERCRTFLLYPHKCRENTFSLWQILAFLLLIPFVAFWIILFAVIGLQSKIVRYRSLRIVSDRTKNKKKKNQSIDAEPL